MIHIESSELARFTAALFTAAGVSESESERVAASLVDADLCGHESHGVVRVREYMHQLRRGELIAGAPLEVLHETDSLLVCDAGFGFGV